MGEEKIEAKVNQEDMTLTKEDFIDLYKEAQSCENQIRTASRNSTSIFTTLLLAVVGGGFTCVRFALPEKILAGCLMICVGLIIFGLSAIAYRQFISDFIRQVEYMTIQGKIEDIIGLTDEKKYHANKFWSKEPIVPNSYIKFRTIPVNSENSSMFIKSLVSGKSTKMKIYYGIFALIGVGFIVGAILVFTGVISLDSITGAKE